MRPRVIVAMPRGAAQVALTVPALYGLPAPLAAFYWPSTWHVAHGMRLSGEGIAGHTTEPSNVRRSADGLMLLDGTPIPDSTDRSNLDVP